MDTRAFAPRITPLRPRVTTLAAHAHQRAAAAALHTELPRSIGRLEALAAPVHDGREDADWTGRRELLRALVQRVDVDHDQVQVVCRVDHRPGDLDPEKKVCTIVGGVMIPPCGVPVRVSFSSPFSSTPARRNFHNKLKIFSSATRCFTAFISVLCGIVSK